MTEIVYRVGDATFPKFEKDRLVYIAHIVNDAGRWGAGFTAALDKRWNDPRKWFLYAHSVGDVRLGHNHYVGVEFSESLVSEGVVSWSATVVVAHLCAQHGTRSLGNRVPFRPEALNECLSGLLNEITKDGCISAEIHMPRIGCGLSGSTWDVVEPIIRANLSAYDVPVFVYDLERMEGVMYEGDLCF